MAYKIEYDSLGGRYEVRQVHPMRFPLLLCGALGIFSLGTMLFWPAGASVLRDCMIPGDDAVTLQALKDMALNLRNHLSLSQAVQTFCQDVIHGANLTG